MGMGSDRRQRDAPKGEPWPRRIAFFIPFFWYGTVFVPISVDVMSTVASSNVCVGLRLVFGE